MHDAFWKCLSARRTGYRPGSCVSKWRNVENRVMRQETNALRVEMVFDRTCPNVERARSMIRIALAQVGAAEAWKEWDRDDPATPADLVGFASPTVLVDRHDVLGA